MASFARRRPPAAVWSVDDASTFAALKEFKLLQLLSADKKAFATARRLGLFSAKPQPQQAQTARSTASRAAPRVPSDAASGAKTRPNARQRRSAARSAQHHAQRQLQVYRLAIAVLYICRLQRRCRARRLRAQLADLESLDGQSVSGDSGDAPPALQCALREKSGSKRVDRPPSSASSSSSASRASSSSSAALLAEFYESIVPSVRPRCFRRV